MSLSAPNLLRSIITQGASIVLPEPDIPVRSRVDNATLPSLHSRYAYVCSEELRSSSFLLPCSWKLDVLWSDPVSIKSFSYARISCLFSCLTNSLTAYSLGKPAGKGHTSQVCLQNRSIASHSRSDRTRFHTEQVFKRNCFGQVSGLITYFQAGVSSRQDIKSAKTTVQEVDGS